MFAAGGRGGLLQEEGEKRKTKTRIRAVAAAKESRVRTEMPLELDVAMEALAFQEARFALSLLDLDGESEGVFVLLIHLDFCYYSFF